MITCHIRHLEQRAAERGYTLQSVEACIVGRSGDMVTVDESHPAYPRPGLGDMVAAGLDAVGITKDRVQRLANAVGIKDCGCKQRQQALNRAGRLVGIGKGPEDTDVQRPDDGSG